VYCRNLGLAVPISVSIKESVTADLYNMLVGVAMDPSVAIAGTSSKSDQWSLKTWAALTGIGAVGVIAAALMVRLYRSHGAARSGGSGGGGGGSV
jgi:mitochondrial Rho GTPase 1